jgi:hypothetical protein
MEKVINNELTRVLLFLAAGVAGLAAVTSNLITKAQGSFKPYRKATLIYLFAGLLFFSVIALAAYRPIAAPPFSMLLIFQAYFLLLGVVHFFSMHQYLAWSGSARSFLAELLFTVLLGLAGGICFLLLYHVLSRNGLQYVMLGSVLFFLLPWLFYQTFKRAVAIPPKILKEWIYPVGEEIDEPEDSKMRNLRVISF